MQKSVFFRALPFSNPCTETAVVGARQLENRQMKFDTAGTELFIYREDRMW